MNTKSIRLTAAFAAAAAAALVVTGCSDDNSSSPATNSVTSATSAAPGTAAPTGGKSSASVDGKALDAKFDTTCAKQGGTLALALTDTGNATYGQLSVSATVTGDDTVQAVGIAGSKGGDNGMPYAVGYGNGVPGGSAEVVKNGNTYTVTGEGVGAPDMSNPMGGVKNSKFEIVFACASIVGS
ncbi:lipoprotein LpqH [Nocardia sp. NBC_01503]|uniref:lipoprotein LpqH n=1 Tax=Nocardia sp. NBC_01503 TaxID=2975997 RepID=UPI002E7ACC58|nr:lipoprotein LpqH [Nocardia sp. NBC_01503]WTL29348.1 lipoprotein LpqH [Nocardia sp. NBC_01503]